MMNNGDWGLGIGDWGLGIGEWGLGRIANPQSPIPNPQSPIPTNIFYLININKNKLIIKKYIKSNNFLIKIF